MASSLLDRIKRQQQSAETFIAAAEAPPIREPAPAATPTSMDPPTIEAAVPETTLSETTTPERSPQTPRAKRAQSEDPRKRDVPRYTFNLRLNDYELELLRSLADEQRDSMQKVVKAGLIPYLEGSRKASNKTSSQ